MIELKSEDVKVAATFGVVQAGGGLDLSAYPLLAYSEAQWGEGVRTEDNGTRVADIFARSRVQPDVIALAAFFNTTVAHVMQATPRSFSQSASGAVVLKHSAGLFRL